MSRQRQSRLVVTAALLIGALVGACAPAATTAPSPSAQALVTVTPAATPTAPAATPSPTAAPTPRPSPTAAPCLDSADQNRRVDRFATGLQASIDANASRDSLVELSGAAGALGELYLPFDPDVTALFDEMADLYATAADADGSDKVALVARAEELSGEVAAKVQAATYYCPA